MDNAPIELTYAETRWSYCDVGFHTHPCWELIYQRDGVTETVQGDRSYMMRPGMILIHPPFMRHRDIYSEAYSVYYIHFKASNELSWPILSYDDGDRTIGRLCDLIYREYHTDGFCKGQLMKVLGIELDVFMRRFKIQDSGTHIVRVVSEAKRVLEERYVSPPNMAELASRLGVSHSSLYSHFKEIYGMSPKRYLMSIRMNHALGLIRHTNSTLETIALSCGFNSVSHLSGQVKEETGLSPGALRKYQEGKSTRDIILD